jgi:hypothetical protein
LPFSPAVQDRFVQKATGGDCRPGLQKKEKTKHHEQSKKQRATTADNQQPENLSQEDFENLFIKKHLEFKHHGN